MKKLAVAFVLVMSLFALSAAAGEWTGYISDSKCAKDPAKVSSDAHAKCAAGCLKKGDTAVLVSDGKVYKLDAAAKVQDHVGHKVTVTGKLDSDTNTIKVAEVKM